MRLARQKMVRTPKLERSSSGNFDGRSDTFVAFVALKFVALIALVVFVEFAIVAFALKILAMMSGEALGGGMDLRRGEEGRES
jgi:hypothetical protein